MKKTEMFFYIGFDIDLEFVNVNIKV